MIDAPRISMNVRANTIIDVLPVLSISQFTIVRPATVPTAHHTPSQRAYENSNSLNMMN